MIINISLAKSKKIARECVDLVKTLSPIQLRKAKKVSRNRDSAIDALNNIFSLDNNIENVDNILVDGLWDNPNYWFRYSLIRKSLGFSGKKESGLIGKYNRKSVKKIFSLMSIDNIVDYHSLSNDTAKYKKEAANLLTSTKCTDDIINWSLPLNFPGSLVFDGILSRQRRATVDLSDPLLVDYVAESLSCIHAAEIIFSENNFNLVVLSHALDYTFAAIAWAGIKRGIPIIVIYGDYGSARFIKMDNENDLFAYPVRPTREEFFSMQDKAKNNLRTVGESYLSDRFSGITNDIGAIYAYKNRVGSINKEEICRIYNWDIEKPIIGVYASNWFDYPHVTGLDSFRDFFDWIEVTLESAKELENINWLFKAHPCDDWYGKINGVKLSDLVDNVSSEHIKIVDKSWDSTQLILSLDGIVTCHGTVGLEAVALGKPVLTAHEGWYGHIGFTKTSTSRKQYIDFLHQNWWKDSVTENMMALAKTFAGWYFCLPDWHGTYVYQDDSKQSSIYIDIPDFIIENSQQINKEMELIYSWFISEHPYYHIYKMKNAESFQSGNTI